MLAPGETIRRNMSIRPEGSMLSTISGALEQAMMYLLQAQQGLAANHNFCRPVMVR
jgi:hypothetical protein